MPKSNAPVKIVDWRRLYEDSLTTEILRSERRRATILAALFAFAACVYSFFCFVPGLLADEFRVRLQSQWPWITSLHVLVALYEWGLRLGIGWLIEQGRRRYAVHRYLNALLETSIPTVMLFMAVSFMGPRDALGSPAFLLYFFFILLSILQLDLRLCLFIGLVAAVAFSFRLYCDRRPGACD
jgi:adenylate cyclase